MADFTSAFPDSGNTTPGENLRDDVPWAGPTQPLVGSPLHALVQRQVGASGFDRRLAFVPAQVR